MVITILFWLAIPLGFLGLPVSAAGYLLLPFALVSLFNAFAAPRGVLLALLVISFASSLPPLFRLCGQLWRLLDPGEENFKHACLLGSEVLSSGATVAYLQNEGWIGGTNLSWLLTSYWFICLVQLWTSGFYVFSGWIERREG